MYCVLSIVLLSVVNLYAQSCVSSVWKFHVHEHHLFSEWARLFIRMQVSVFATKEGQLASLI